MGMFGPKMGIYTLQSKSDPRFNKEWERIGAATAGVSIWMDEWIKKKCKELGLENFPADLMFSFHKNF